MTDLSPDIIGRVDRLSLRPTPENALLPLFEAVSNALHAVDDRYKTESAAKGLVEVEILRADLSRDDSPVTGFAIRDNGIGLDQANFGSFSRPDSRHKAKRGGKGIGRLGWLKVFTEIEVDSTYFEGEEKLQRSFNFRLSERNQIDDCPPRSSCPHSGGTRVMMRDYKLPFQGRCPTDADVILQRLAQHFLNVVVAEEPITILVTDASTKTNLADFVGENIRKNDLDPVSLQFDFSPEPIEFVIRHLKIAKRFRPAKGFNRMLMFGNDRAANEKNIDTALGLGMLDGDEIYIGCISSAFLDSHVNSERTGFTISEDELAEIRRSLMTSVATFLHEQVNRVKEQKHKTA